MLEPTTLLLLVMRPTTPPENNANISIPKHRRGEQETLAEEGEVRRKLLLDLSLKLSSGAQMKPSNGQNITNTKTKKLENNIFMR